VSFLVVFHFVWFETSLLRKKQELRATILEKENKGGSAMKNQYPHFFAHLLGPVEPWYISRIARADVEELAQGIVAWHQELDTARDTTCLFRDSAFADNVTKTNMAAIREQHGMANVRSL